MLDPTNNSTADPTGHQQLMWPQRQLFNSDGYSLAVWLRKSRTPSGNFLIFAERRYATDGNYGWLFYWSSASNKLSMQHLDGSSNASIVNTTTIASTTLYLFVLVWDGSSYQWYKDNGVADGNGSFTKGIAHATADLTIGDDSDLASQAFPGFIGHIIAWPSIQLSQSEVQTLYAGSDIPQSNAVRFWYRGTEILGIDEYTGLTPSQNGNLWLKSLDPPDSYYADVSLGTYIQNYHAIQMAGQNLHRKRLPEVDYSIDAPIEMLGREINDTMLITHSSGLEPKGVGFGMGPNSPSRLASLVEMSLDPETKKIKLGYVDVRRFVLSMYDQLIASHTVFGEQRGIFQVYPPGVEKTIDRESNIWVEEEGGEIVKLDATLEPLTIEGCLIESDRTNEFANSSFKSGVSTDWSAVGATGGASVENDSDDLLFDPDVTPYSCKIIADSPLGGTPVGIEQDITLSDTSPRRVYIFHKDDGGQPISISIQRDSDSYYLQSLTADSWGASIAYLEIDTASEIEKYKIPTKITPGGGSITYTTTFYAKTGNGQVNHIYHAQWEIGDHCSSPIVTAAGSTYNRVPTVETISNNIGARIWPLTRGTLYFRFKPLWDSDEIENQRDLLYLYHDADNYVKIYYDPSSPELEAQFRADGVNYYSTIDTTSISWGAGDEIMIAFRWAQADDLENDEFEIQLFANFGDEWIEGTKENPASNLVEVDASYLQLGAVGTSDEYSAADGTLYYLRISPEVFLLEEIEAFP